MCPSQLMYFTIMNRPLSPHDVSDGLPDSQLAGLNLSHAGIELDATSPVVVSLYSAKETSPWGGVYTVGEEVC